MIIFLKASLKLTRSFEEYIEYQHDEDTQSK